jgi:hypothetical protein
LFFWGKQKILAFSMESIIIVSFLVFTINREPKAMDRIHGAVAQLGEHYLRKVGVGGSNPLCSRNLAKANFWLTVDGQQ